MATTPTYNWQMPDPTDFVTNLPADFETFGDAVDATVSQIETKLDVITTEGDLVVGDASGDPVRVPIGTAGQVLASDGDTVEWVTATSGGMQLIATATPSAATTVSFTSIPTNFKMLLLVSDSVFQSVGLENSFRVRLNNDSGNNYFNFGFRVQAGGTPGFGNSNNDAIGSSFNDAFVPQSNTTDTTLNRTSNSELWIYNADQTTGRKRYTQTSINHNGSNFSGQIAGGGIYTGTSAISQIDLIRNDTQTITGTIRLYGFL